jgi:hypothetical protein
MPFWSKRRPSAYVRNRPFLRSPVMERLDALFADRDRNAALYETVLASRPVALTDAYLAAVFSDFDAGDPDGSAAVRTHAFSHILGPDSWWGSRASQWEGERILASGYVEAIRRAQALGNVPIKTFHLQSSSDGSLQVHVLEVGEAVAVIIATPPVPGGHVANVPVVKHPGDDLKHPYQPNMPDVAAVTLDTIDQLEVELQAQFPI